MEIRITPLSSNMYNVQKYNGNFTGVPISDRMSATDFVEVCNRYNIKIINKEELPTEIQNQLNQE